MSHTGTPRPLTITPNKIDLRQVSWLIVYYDDHLPKDKTSVVFDHHKPFTVAGAALALIDIFISDNIHLNKINIF